MPPTTVAGPASSRITKWRRIDASESAASRSSSARSHPAVDRPPGQSGGGERVERQDGVEGELDDQAPGLREAAIGDRLNAAWTVADRQRVQQRELLEGAVSGNAGEAGDDDQDDEDEPVGGEDPEQAALCVVDDGGRRGSTRPVSDERAIEEEAGDQEEDRDSDVEVEDELAGDRIADLPEHTHVEDQHREHGDRPHPVEKRKARVVRGRGDRVGRGGRAGGVGRGDPGHVRPSTAAASTAAIASAAAG